MQAGQFFLCSLMIVFLIVISRASAQTDSLLMHTPVIQVSGGADVFYAYDANRPKTGYRQVFMYNHNRHNEIQLNHGYLKSALRYNRVRANLALHAGTYVQDNYASEPGILKPIFEANAGFALHPNHKIWLDAGIMSSHIGFEGAISMDNLTLTRSICAENSPYYMAGMKLTYSPSVQWEIAGLISNGWQRIQPVSGNTLPAFGTQVKYMPNAKLTLNWSTFAGTHDPDTTRRMRYFNNLFAQFTLHDRWTLICGFDYGIQQQQKYSRQYDAWFTPAILIQCKLSEHWASAMRAEYYQDSHGIIISSDHLNGFSAAGYSLNLDYAPKMYMVFRIEGRMLHSADALFIKGNHSVQHNFFVTASAAFRLQKRYGI